MINQTGRKYRHFVHSPFKLEYEGVTVEVNEQGLVKLTTQEEEYDEVNTTASLINCLSKLFMIAGYQKVIATINFDGNVTLHQYHEDGTFDEINCKKGLIQKISRLVISSRSIVWKDEPFHYQDEEVEKE